jgi:hypothetical protein
VGYSGYIIERKTMTVSREAWRDLDKHIANIMRELGRLDNDPQDADAVCADDDGADGQES